MGIGVTLVQSFIGTIFLMIGATFVQGFICDRGHIGTTFPEIRPTLVQDFWGWGPH